MKRQGIDYRDIMNLGFTEQVENDNVYFNQYGYSWAIITLQLTKRIYIDWSKDTRVCQMIRVNKKEDIKARYDIKSIEELKQIIDFFTDKPKVNYSPVTVA